MIEIGLVRGSFSSLVQATLQVPCLRQLHWRQIRGLQELVVFHGLRALWFRFKEF